MINRTYFVPQHWEVRQGDAQWAIEKFGITSSEVYRQIELLRDHEFRRPYSSWDRVFRNWIRKADEMQTLRKERKLRLVDDTPAEPGEREAEAQRAWEQMERLAGRKLR